MTNGGFLHEWKVFRNRFSGQTVRILVFQYNTIVLLHLPFGLSLNNIVLLLRLILFKKFSS